MNTKLIEKDNRHPVTVAFALALRENMADAKTAVSWRQEMEDLVEETTKKFVGFFAKGSVRKGLNLVLGILSLPVADATKGSYDPKAWAKCLLKHGPKGLAKRAIEMVGSLVSSVGAELITITDRKPLREKLLRYAKGRDYKDHHTWIGHKLYQEAVDSVDKAEILEKCLEWIAKDTPFTNLTRLKAEQAKESGEEPHSDTLFNTILFRVSVGRENWRNLPLTKEELDRAYRSFKKNRKLWVKEARKRYDSFKQTMPQMFHKAFVWDREWFDIHLAKGPPSVPKGKWYYVRQNVKFGYYLVVMPKDKDMPL